VKLSIRDMVLVAFFSALMAVGAFISKVWPPEIIPFSLLPLLCMLAGAIIGPRLGALSIIVYILVGLTGVPVFASAPFGGVTYLLKPSFGFLIGFAAAAYVTGYIIYKKENPGWGSFISAMFIGIAVIYLIGLPWMYLVLNFYVGKAITFMQIVAMMSMYMVLDVVKAMIGAVVGKAIYARVESSLQLNHN